MPYSRPGIYLTEGNFSTNIQSVPAGTAAAFLGTAERGPTKPYLVQSWNDYKANFGDLSADYELGYALYHFFANGGRYAYVTRVVSGASAAKAATKTFTGGVAGASAGDLFTLTASSIGTWGNNLTVDITSGTVTGTNPTFNMSVKYNGAEVENWSELSLNKNDSRFIEAVLNTYSTYVTTSLSGSFATAGASYSIAAASGQALTTGNDGSAVASADWASAVSKLDQVEGALLVNLVGQHSSTIVSDVLDYVDPSRSRAGGGGNKRTVADSFVIIDPSPSATSVSDIQTVVNGYGTSSYGAVYYGMLLMSNPAVKGSAALRNTFPGGAVAGLYQRIEAERGPSRAPAGYAYELRNVFGVVTPFTESEVGNLYNPTSASVNSVNTFKAVPGAGVIINGTRTLKRTDITKFIPVRLTLNYVKSQVNALTKPSLFEPINNRLFAGISSNIAKLLNQLWASGGLKGRSASEAFYVVCDDTNNTSATIEAGEVHVEVGVSLQTPAEYIVVNVSQFTGGSTVSETL